MNRTWLWLWVGVAGVVIFNVLPFIIGPSMLWFIPCFASGMLVGCNGAQLVVDRARRKDALEYTHEPPWEQRW